MKCELDVFGMVSFFLEIGCATTKDMSWWELRKECGRLRTETKIATMMAELAGYRTFSDANATRIAYQLEVQKKDAEWRDLLYDVLDVMSSRLESTQGEKFSASQGLSKNGSISEPEAKHS